MKGLYESVRKPGPGKNSMCDNIFYDTSILASGFDAADPRKHEVSSRLIIQAFEQGTGVISAQVLKEFYITVTKKIALTMAPDKAEQVIRDFALWRVVETTVPLILRGIPIHIENRSK
jgi:predicted nucleic acid-binding protein